MNRPNRLVDLFDPAVSGVDSLVDRTALVLVFTDGIIWPRNGSLLAAFDGLATSGDSTGIAVGLREATDALDVERPKAT